MRAAFCVFAGKANDEEGSCISHGAVAVRLHFGG